MSRSEHARALATSDPVIADRNITVECTCDDCTVVSMPMQPSMCNAYNIGHGAYIFMIADVAMSLASSIEDGTALASSAHIDWLKPVEMNDTVRATATCQYASGRQARWMITVTDGNDEPVAIFRGRTQQLRK